VSSIELIRSGIIGGDWALVCEGYAGMTGQKLEPPKPGVYASVSIPDSFVEDLKRYIDEEVAKLRVGLWPEVADALESQPYYPPDPDLSPAAAEQEEFSPDTDVGQTADELAAGYREVAAAAQPPKAEDEFAKFHIPMGRTQPLAPGNGDRSVSTPRPHDPKAFRNDFKDDGRVAIGDAELDRKMTAKLKPSERRPESKLVEVVCGKCDRPERVPPALVPPSLGAADDRPAHVCNACLRGARR
jgi:hypothetical protein